MHQLKPATNLVLAVLAGLGLLGSLTLPWYAAPTADPGADNGAIEHAAYQVGQVFASGVRGTVNGDDALGGARTILIAVVGVVAVLALLISLNVLRKTFEDLLRLVVLATPVIFVVLAVTHPGTDADVRLHYGMIVSAAATLAMASAAWQGASWRAKRAAPVRPRYGATSR